MKLLPFIVLNAAFVVVDGVVTYGLVDFASINVLVARFFGALFAVVGISIILRRTHPSGSFLATAISTMTIIVSYGLFALILARNPILQWPVAYATSAVAALLLGAIGYRRALKRRVMVV
ncbi:hypothetical protein RMR16_014705 [Agrobacterium sp. rho-13.3]|uniref:hypothetical protein n=1 Tax=Agrobacterium sp. rho-13.3 TaxID=3072980 RepID=UPI002A164BFA|nr:hypothetical protein [Agrobacterium sp. rho-13.3]MDX8309685.1 hypothetical protein [Agrobacterium sp. rho-13.3]